MRRSETLVLVTGNRPAPIAGALPGVVEQTSWRVVEERIGSVPFTHLDLFFVEDASACDALVAALRGCRQALLCERVAGPESAHPTDTLFFNPYTPREDAQERGFHEFLRNVDNPFQNGLPEMVDYTNWRVLEARVGPLDFTDFDLQYVDGRAGAEALLANEEKKRFGRGWVERWGRNPEGELAENYRKCLCERVLP